MKLLKIPLLLGLCMMMLTACDSDDSLSVDELEAIGVIGAWEIEQREVNGVSSLTVLCCDFIEFTTDENLLDLVGQFRSYGVGYETLGTFEINTTDQTILFTWDNRQLLYSFEVQSDALIFQYDDHGDNVSETWRRQD